MRASEYMDNLSGALFRRDTWRKLPVVDILFFSHDVNLGETRDGLAYSRLQDTVAADLSRLGVTCAVVANQYSRLTGSRAWGRPYAINRMAARSAFTRVVFSDRLAAGQRKRMYSRVIERARPRLIVTLGTPHELAQAAKESGVRVVEVDHSRGRGAPSPIEMALTPQHMPDDLIVFDRTAYQGLQPLREKGLNIHLCRDPWHDLFIGPKVEIPNSWQFPDDRMPDVPKRVLVTLQWGSPRRGPGSNILRDGFMPETVAHLIQQEHDDVFWYLRMHPVQLRRRGYAYVRSYLANLQAKYSNVDWVMSSRLPLPSMLRASTHHVTWNSNSTVEACQMGIPTALLDPDLRLGQPLESYYALQRESGWATLVDPHRPSRLLDWLNTAHTAPPNNDGATLAVSELLAAFVRTGRAGRPTSALLR